jgi:hypothetical protein
LQEGSKQAQRTEQKAKQGRMGLNPLAKPFTPASQKQASAAAENRIVGAVSQNLQPAATSTEPEHQEIGPGLLDLPQEVGREHLKIACFWLGLSCSMVTTAPWLSVAGHSVHPLMPGDCP